jgi:hypothetical protein
VTRYRHIAWGHTAHTKPQKILRWRCCHFIVDIVSHYHDQLWNGKQGMSWGQRQSLNNTPESLPPRRLLRAGWDGRPTLLLQSHRLLVVLVLQMLSFSTLQTQEADMLTIIHWRLAHSTHTRQTFSPAFMECQVTLKLGGRGGLSCDIALANKEKKCDEKISKYFNIQLTFTLSRLLYLEEHFASYCVCRQHRWLGLFPFSLLLSAWNRKQWPELTRHHVTMRWQAWGQGLEKQNC